VAIALALASLVMLVYLIHHVSTLIQASHILRVIADNIQEAIPQLYPSETGEPIKESEKQEFLRDRKHEPAAITGCGYLQSVDLDDVMSVATDNDLLVELLVKPGDHLVPGDQVARIWFKQQLESRLSKRIVAAFLLGGERTPLQDIRYLFQQLTDVVVRALSPGINDPFTAINGVDELATGMVLLSRRSRVAANRKDEKGVLRLSVPTPTIGELLDETVGHIAIYAAGDRFVAAGLRRVLGIVEHNVSDESEIATIARLRDDLNQREQAKQPR
jgi:uncharacterized membrane protein